MPNKTQILVVCAAINVMLINIIIKRRLQRRKYKDKRKRSVWCKEWLSRRSEGKGILSLLNKELKTEDPYSYNNFLRLCEDQCDYILHLINDDIKTEDTFFRNAVPSRSKLSRARRIVESSFGILANRFRVLLNPINLSAEKVEKITLACVVLHNFLCVSKGRIYTDGSDKSPITLTNLQRIQSTSSNRSADAVRMIRNEYKEYFNSPVGMVEWQETVIRNNNI
ncbi:hypothetical protein PPYR_00430 [Photinus pyralis]|uniref:DDE Tnp4 domain-containing protein n=1 Tax=Photinus pyralis TaxID=7054 RepID=A0A5N4B241_PHOPY|nr:hypothetical protein PPYR_00430 [Photinus pyralis]